MQHASRSRLSKPDRERVEARLHAARAGDARAEVPEAVVEDAA